MTRDPASVVLERTVELARVPAPPLDEADRAEVVTGWWRRDGLEPHIDPVGNVVARLRTGRGPAIFVAAHLDTVFGRDVPHGTEQRAGRLHGVGVGDNTVAVAALSVMDRLLPQDLDRPVWIAATVGEEGFGNLTGARHLVEHPPAEIGAMVALEGNYLGRVVTIGVGSVRWLAELEGPGGHAWEAADNPSAIHDLARIITGLERLLPDARNRARCSINVGHIEGGESINARARRAALRIDIRSADPVVLADLDAAARRVVYTEKSSAVRANFKELGKRPAGSIPDTHPLVRAAEDALAAIGMHPELAATSTDANAAYAAGLPAITIGITVGSGEHTPGEWIETAPIGAGLTALVDTITRYDRKAG